VQPPREDVAGSDIVVGRHDEMRVHRLRPCLARKGGKLQDDAVGAEVRQQLQLGGARCLGAFNGPRIAEFASGTLPRAAVKS
jgi:hypothetical protein